MNKTRLIYLIIVAALLSSCVMATVEGVQGKYDNDPVPTPDEQMQGWVVIGGVFGLFVLCTILARGGGLRDCVFTVIGLGIAACMFLA
jgi:hypothetical protein